MADYNCKPQSSDFILKNFEQMKKRFKVQGPVTAWNIFQIVEMFRKTQTNEA